MVGRRGTSQEDGTALAIRTDLGGKEKALGSNHGTAVGAGREAIESVSRTGSMNSLATSAEEQIHTHLSASSAGITDTLSSSDFSSHSTARTSEMSDDDRPLASCFPSSSSHAHPTLTILELVSNTASSSALPDTFAFNVSRKGTFVAVYTASNIWLIKAAELPRLFARTLQVKRKPVAVDITEDGFLFAVLARPSQVDLYEIHSEQDRAIRKRRTISLVHETSSLAISPDGLILITTNNFGIEVIAIGPDAPETLRRSLSGPTGDALEFSDDGRTLLITSYARKSGGSSLYVLPGLYDGPVNDEGEPLAVAPETVWTGSVLFPETARIARQATLLRDPDSSHVNELFAFNAQEDSWGIYDIGCQRFTQRKMFLPDQQRWTRSEFIDDAMPAVSPNTDLAAVALRMRGITSIWIYEVPGWDYKPSPKATEQSPIQPCFCIPILHEGLDNHQDICALRWVKISSTIQRLVAVGNMSNAPTDSAVPSVPLGSKGVIIVMDFDGSNPVGSPRPVPIKTEYDLDPLCPGELLPEGSIDFEREVELVRTRTMAQRRAQTRESESRRQSRSSVTPGRSQTTANRERQTSTIPSVPTITRNEEEELTMEEAQAAFEVPYDHQQPRSQMSLARAATVAAVSPANRRHLRALPFRPLEYRRADGLREFPHESDADNWVPPPPAYTENAAASESVSLSHPNAPPLPTQTFTAADASIPPVPPLPANISSSQLMHTHPYQSHGNSRSHSSTNVAVVQPQHRRPSLLHPQTFPNPQSAVSGRRRSSTTQAPPQQQPAPQPQNLSAYNATSSHYSATRRPTGHSRRVVESTVDLRPPPMIDPSAGRRGSAPDPGMHRRPATANATSNRAIMPHGPSSRSNTRRPVLPRLSTPELTSQHGPLSAPPRTNTSHARGQPRSGVRETSKEPGKKKKISCAVM